jgi:hypothetical protein
MRCRNLKIAAQNSQRRFRLLGPPFLVREGHGERSITLKLRLD